MPAKDQDNQSRGNARVPVLPIVLKPEDYMRAKKSRPTKEVQAALNSIYIYNIGKFT